LEITFDFGAAFARDFRGAGAAAPLSVLALLLAMLFNGYEES
jgi:hypothetical protein